ncbi:MAG: Lrp/AsnC family transcriptional regulator [Anaerolineae bacterium]|nr:Lrp/AsnC family transcriptional regulator [Anaerolineae bacterium]
MKYSSEMIDDIDRVILREIQQDSAISQVELARRVSLSPPAVHARMRRLEELGIIRQYVALLDREKAGYDMLCLVNVTLQRHQLEQVNNFRAAVQQMPEVLECFFVTGDHDYLLKIIVRNRKELEQFLMDRLTPIPGVARISTSLVLSEVKNTTAILIE